MLLACTLLPPPTTARRFNFMHFEGLTLRVSGAVCTWTTELQGEFVRKETGICRSNVDKWGFTCAAAHVCSSCACCLSTSTVSFREWKLAPGYPAHVAMHAASGHATASNTALEERSCRVLSSRRLAPPCGRPYCWLGNALRAGCEKPQQVG